MNAIMQDIYMHIIIDKEMFFRPADGAIWNIGAENEKRYLTLTCSRLLEFLIEHRGEIISRDAIFQAVWERYGLNASNNTLNQYISLLRRTLADFGLSAQTIKTIPKTGFLFSSELSISVVLKEQEPEDTGARHRFKPLMLCLLCLLIILLVIGIGQSRAVSLSLPVVWAPQVEAKRCGNLFPVASDNQLLACFGTQVAWR